jgi:hypothetical protein
MSEVRLLGLKKYDYCFIYCSVSPNSVRTMEADSHNSYISTTPIDSWDRQWSDTIKMVKKFGVWLLLWIGATGLLGAQGWPGVYEPTQLLTLNLQMEPADWATIQTDSSYSIEVPAQFWADGETPILVSVRRKDSDPLTANPAFAKVSIRVDFNDFVTGQEWRDLKKLSLENGDDSGALTEGFAWQIYGLANGTRGFGYRAAQASWVRLLINGVDTGIYVNPEFRDKRMLENRNLYVPGLTWLYESEIREQLDPIFGAPPDSPTVEALCYEPFQQPPTCPQPDLLTEVPQWVNMQGLLSIMAAGAFTADNDALISAHKNYYIADFASGPKRRYYPWDMDAALPGRTDYDIYVGRRNSTFLQLLEVPEFRAQYSQILNDMVCGPWSEASLHGLLDSLDPLLTPALVNDLNSGPGFAGLYTWVSERLAHVIPLIENFQPCPTVQLDLNELMASNVATLEDPAEPGEYPDWFEIYNPSTVPVPVGGIYVTDDPLDPTKYEIPNGVTIPAQGYLLMYADDDGTQGPDHTNFKLGASGGELQIYDRDGVTLLDSVSWTAQQADVAYGRYPDGSGPFDFLPMPTPSSSNLPHNPPPQVSGTARSVLWPTNSEWVAVQSQVIDNGSLAEVELHYGAGAGEMVLPMVDLGAGLFEATIPPLVSGTIVRYWVTAVDDLGAMGREPLTAPSLTFTYQVDYIPPPLVINEFMASNLAAVEDPDEPLAHEDWIELYNPSASPISLDGMYVTDNLFAPTKYALPNGLVVPAGGHLVLWADGEPLQGANHLSFKLTAAGEEIGLFDADIHGNVSVDSLNFGLQVTDVSEGRCPDGTGIFVSMSVSTPAAPNAGSANCADLDLDGAVDLIDNCPAVVNAAQLDTDGDSVGDLCDNCPTLTNAGQQDFDLDGAGDNCDNCLTVANLDQSDFDLDLEGDACDLDDGLIRVEALPTKSISWQNEAGYSSWNVYRGDLETLRQNLSYTQPSGSNPNAEQFCAILPTALVDGSPMVGTVAFYLVSGVGPGGEGSLGTDSAGAPRTNNSPCP